MNSKKIKDLIKHYLSVLIPILILALGGVFFMTLEKTGGTSGPLCAFKNLLWWLAGLLALLSAGNIIDELLSFFEARKANKKGKKENKEKERKEGNQTRITRFCAGAALFFKRFTKKKNEDTSSAADEDLSDKAQSATSDELDEIPSELKNIRRAEPVSESRKKEKTAFDKIRAVVFALIVILIAIGLYYFCKKLFAKAAYLGADTYSYGLVTTLYFLFFAVLTSVYVKMRAVPKKKVIYRISGDIIKIVSAVAIVYAGVIAVESVLAINAIAVIPWVIRAVAVYFTIVIAVNLVIALLKSDMLADLDYSLLPTGDKRGEGVLESDSVRARFSLKSIWSIKYALRLLPSIVLTVGAVLFLSTMFYVVQPGEQAALYRLGRIDENKIMEPGFHVKFPWPIDKIDVYDVDSVTTVRIGYDNPTGTDYLWTASHGGKEYPLLTGNGNEVVAVNIKLAYRIDDLYSYVNTATNPESVLSAAAYESIMRRTVNTTLDAFLSVDRASLSYDLKEELERLSKDTRLGIEVVDVIIENIHPPVDVADVYQAVITASVDKATLITSAKSDALKLLNHAEYYKEQLINNAMKKQAELVGAATGEMAYYFAAMEAYKVNPECFKLTQYIDVQARRIAGTKVYYFSPKTEKYTGSFVVGGSVGAVITTEE